MGVVYGIDLGTTFTSAAFCAEDGSVTVCRFDDGSGSGRSVEVLPSVALLEDRGAGKKPGVAVGFKARELYTDDENQLLVECAKREIGLLNGPGGRARSWCFAGREHSPQVIQALILRALSRLLLRQGYPPLTEAVITHPQYFSDPQKKATVQSAELARLAVAGTLTEPAAAALAYGIDNLARTQGKPRTVFIFDLGGGTFDTVIFTIANPPLSITGVTSGGSSQLGGRDWDRVLYNRMVEEINRVCNADFDLDASIIEQQGLMKRDRAKRDPNKFCRYHNDIGHHTNNCYALKDEVERLIREGWLQQYTRQDDGGLR